MVRTIRPWTWLLGSTVVIAAIMGASTAFLMQSDDGSPGSSLLGGSQAQAEVVFGPDGSALGRERMGHPAITFPPALSGLPAPPSYLAVDRSTGDLWFILFTHDGTSNVLYQYDPSDGTTKMFSLPASTGSELFSAIAVDERGHVIVAEGEHVLDFDPAFGAFREFRLPPLEGAPSGHEGTFITDMALDGKDNAYLGRMNSGEVATLRLATGELGHIPVPSSFGVVYFLAFGSDGLWMSNWAGSGVSAQMARVEPGTGELLAVPGGASALEAEPGNTAYSAKLGTNEVTKAAAGSSTSAATEVPGSVSGLRDVLAVDTSRDSVWVTGEGAVAISRVDGKGNMLPYRLPQYVTIVYPRCPFIEATPAECGPEEVAVKTRVRGLAIAPNGDLYFSDATRNRIGVIRAGQ